MIQRGYPNIHKLIRAADFGLGVVFSLIGVAAILLVAIFIAMLLVK